MSGYSALPTAKAQHYNPKRTGSQHPDGGPTGIFRCGDGTYLTLATLPHQWDAFVDALQMPQLKDDARFTTAALRRDNNDALKDILEAWLARFATRAEAIATLEQKRIPCAPVLTVREAMQHPHMRQRGVVRRIRDPYLGEFEIPGPLARFSAWSAPEPLPAALLGAHNEEVLRSLAGLNDAEIARLYQERVLVRDRLLDSPETPGAVASP